MHLPITASVAFVGAQPSLALRDYIVETIEPLLQDDTIGCRVTLERQEHLRADARFRSKIEIDVPHGTLVVGATNREAFGDPQAAIDDAIDEMRRVLHERASRRGQRHRERHARPSAKRFVLRANGALARPLLLHRS
jgi:ribosome-associated translation inhibitor RaiA